MGKTVRWWAVAMLLMVATLSLGESPAEARGSAAAQGCTLTPTGTPQERSIGGRMYLLHVPAGLPASNAKLLISMHGWIQSARGHMTDSGLNTFANRAGFIVAYPQGTYDLPLGDSSITFDGWDFMHRSSADITFLRSVVADISATYCVDPRRVHADGWSAGGLMSQRLACQASDVFASVSGHATNDVTRAWFDRPDMPSEPCTLSRPTSVYLSCGEDDDNTDNGCRPARDAWAARLGCPAPTQVPVPFGEYRSYSPCNRGTQHGWRFWADLGHTYPPADAARNQWFNEMNLFFTANPRP